MKNNDTTDELGITIEDYEKFYDKIKSNALKIKSKLLEEITQLSEKIDKWSGDINKIKMSDESIKSIIKHQYDLMITILKWIEIAIMEVYDTFVGVCNNDICYDRLVYELKSKDKKLERLARDISEHKKEIEDSKTIKELMIKEVKKRVKDSDEKWKELKDRRIYG